jgi:hypothetical protein
MKRRTLLLSAAGAAGAFIGWRAFKSTDVDAILAVIRKRLSYLQLDEVGVQAFARDLASRHVISSLRLRSIATAGPVYASLALSGQNRFHNGIRHGEERVVTYYLLSSDFFLNGADQSRVIRYLGYYDPFRACGNPFARIGSPSAVA